jgi:NAD(P)-dependent dehydrogenase (short-subunit alcohol dehydrogenase family)
MHALPGEFLHHIGEARPSSPIRLEAGTRTLLKKSSDVSCALVPSFFRLRPRSKPGRSASTTMRLMPLAPWLRIGLAGHEEEIGRLAVGDEGLLAGDDDIVVAVADRGRTDRLQIGAAAGSQGGRRHRRRRRHRPRHRCSCNARRKARRWWSTTSALACRARAATPGPAQKVVAEIQAAGGQAAANTDSVAPRWRRPAASSSARSTAFGRIDAVVNNAGILRDRFFHKMSVDEFDAVIKVHLYGAFYVSSARRPTTSRSRQRAYVHMTSTSGLIGNFGQANYAAAKLGIVGAVASPSRWTCSVQRALQLHRAVRLEPHDRQHPDRHARAAGARGQDPADDTGQDRADGGLPGQRSRPRTSTARSSPCATTRSS